jgi:ABC-type multidrug transport system permease subunit
MALAVEARGVLKRYGIVPTAPTAQAVGSVVFFLQKFLSGAAFPREMFPDTLKSVMQYLPIRQINALVSAGWRKGAWNGIVVIALVARHAGGR